MMIFRWLDTAFRRVQLLDFLPLLAIRIYLLPIFCNFLYSLFGA